MIWWRAHAPSMVFKSKCCCSEIYPITVNVSDLGYVENVILFELQKLIAEINIIQNKSFSRIFSYLVYHRKKYIWDYIIYEICNVLLWFFNQLINDLQAQSLLLPNQRHLSLMHFSTRCNSCQCVSYMRIKVTFLFSDFILNVNRVCFPFLLHAWKIFLKWCLHKFCSDFFYFHYRFIFVLLANIVSSLVASSVMFLIFFIIFMYQ